MRNLISVLMVFGMTLAFSNTSMFNQSSPVLKEANSETWIHLDLQDKLTFQPNLDSIRDHPEAHDIKKASTSTSGILEHDNGIRIYKRLGKERTQKVLDSARLEWLVNY